MNFLELAFAAGGEILSEDGKKSVIDSPENLKALEFMVDGIKDGAAPKAVTTYMEEEARRTFEAGRADFVRQWPYAYALGNMKGSKVKGKFEVAPYPEFEGGGKAAILGGHNMVISDLLEEPGRSAEADRLPDVRGADDQERRRLLEDAGARRRPTRTRRSRRRCRSSTELKQAVEQAKSRPVSPVYTQISQAIYKNVNDALSGSADPKAALEKAQEDMDKALATF